MKRAVFKILTVFFGVFIFVESSQSQDTINTVRSSSRLLLENHWLHTDNIAGTAFNPFLPDGDFVLGFISKEGDMRRVQLSPNEQIYSFNSEKSVRINKLLFNGNIGYENKQQKDVGWTARMNPVTHNPYMLADSLYGLYIKDYVHLAGGLSYMINKRFSTGVQVNYQVGDGARIKDPRAKNKLFKLEAYPSFIYSLNKMKLGLNLYLLTGREKINYSTLENSTTYRFFRTLGLGKTTVPVNGWSYERNYYLSGYGGEFQVQYSIGGLKLLSGFGYSSVLEKSEDGSSYPRKTDSGDFEEKRYSFYTILNYHKNLIQSFGLHLDASTGQGIEFLQEPYTEEGITRYRTIAEIENYTTLEFMPRIKYTLAKPYNVYSNKWEITVDAGMDVFSSEYLLEAEQSYTNILSDLQFKKSFYLKKNFIRISTSGILIYNLDNKLEQLNTYTASQEIAIWNHIIEPDFFLTTSNLYTLKASLRYGRNFQLLKVKNSLIYIDFGINYSSASHDQWSRNKTFKLYHFTLGFTY